VDALSTGDSEPTKLTTVFASATNVKEVVESVK